MFDLDRVLLERTGILKFEVGFQDDIIFREHLKRYHCQKLMHVDSLTISYQVPLEIIFVIAVMKLDGTNRRCFSDSLRFVVGLHIAKNCQLQ